LQAGFAYATVSGLASLRKTKSGQDWLADTESEWIVGIDGGITEPAALDLLRLLPNTDVRLYLPTAEISPRTLLATPKFHAKIVRLRVGNPLHTAALWAGSANATGGALGQSAKNFEAGLWAAAGSITPQDEALFDAWWQHVWDASKPITARLIAKYAEARETTFRKSPILLETMEPPSIEAVSKAKVLWMDVGSASGGARNQIEFNETLAAFFAPPVKADRPVDIIHKKTTVHDRPLAYKKTTYGVDIWRLGLPTGFSYPGKRIKLTRLSSKPGENPRFELQVASLKSGESKAWFREANKKGHVERTHGTSTTKPPREYGYY
jgi:hypothetical protein